MYQKLADHLSQFNIIDAYDIALIKEYFNPTYFAKGELIHTEGKICERILFIVEGYCQVYVRNEVDEKTVHIAGDGDFIAALSSFLSCQPSDENVSAITDVKALSISHTDLHALYDSSKAWERLGRVTMENLFVRKQKRVVSFIKHSAERRYENLMADTPELLQYVPLRILASYLGIKPETLSRIRAKIS